MSSNNGKKFLFFFLLLVIVGLSGTYVFYAEKELPQVELSPKTGFVTAKTPLEVIVRDSKSGLSRVSVAVTQGQKTQSPVTEDLGKDVREWRSRLELEGLGLEDGSLQVRVSARDRSWKNFFQGNEQVQNYSLVLDTRAPRIQMETFRHNLNQGGAGLLGFSTSEPIEQGGVVYGDAFFPAYATNEGRYYCLFAVPHTLDADSEKPLVQVQDRAGNTKRTGFRFHLNRRKFPTGEIQITEQFLDSKMVHFQEAFPDTQDHLKLFLKVNRIMREENRKRLQAIGRETASRPLWSGRFLRQKGARRSGFASRRTYLYQGQEIDRQIHLGVDIASLARAGVEASNSGQVVYADWLGIYGQVVIIDHGLGLQTLYAHLSEMAVQKGDRVEKADVIGRTGATGMAGGDHLHFAVVISGYPVNPVEWWDRNWVRNNIAGKLGLSD